MKLHLLQSILVLLLSAFAPVRTFTSTPTLGHSRQAAVRSRLASNLKHTPTRRQVLQHTGAILTTSTTTTMKTFGSSSTSNGEPSATNPMRKARIAVIGAGWWTQGWHLPQLHRNPNAEIAAIVQRSEQPSSKLADLKSRTDLSKDYQAPWYEDISDVFADDNLPAVDGVLVATPHSTHYSIGKQLLEEAHRRRRANETPLHISWKNP